MKPKTHIQEKLRRMSEQQKMLQEKKREIEEKLAEQKRCFYQQDGLYNHLEYVESINNSKQNEPSNDETKIKENKLNNFEEVSYKAQESTKPSAIEYFKSIPPPMPQLPNFNPNLPPPPFTIPIQHKQNFESQKSKKDLEAEYESFLLLTGQISNKPKKELYNPEEASDEEKEIKNSDDHNKKNEYNDKFDALKIEMKPSFGSFKIESKYRLNNVGLPDNDEKKNQEDCTNNLNSKKLKSRWSSDESEKSLTIENTSIKNEKAIESDNEFLRQMKEATERAKNLAKQINNQISQYQDRCSSTSSSYNQMTDEQRKQYAEQKELQGIFEIMMTKRREIESMAKSMKRKYEYDSDEECDNNNGTWEHKLRNAEMEATKEWAMKLTEMAQGKHHIGDFLPPEELNKFMQTYKSLKNGQTPDLSDYKDFKLNAENVGFKMLQKLGWKEGQGLGKANQGISTPINKSSQSVDHSGLGQIKPDNLTMEDNDFDMYRKRMMLAYKFRPNPMNNPRRPY